MENSLPRVTIAFFGKRNAGKSSLVNAVTSQDMSIVSPVKGTTTDPVKKSMEILPLGPVVIIDTPGIDDQGSLGQLRVEKTKRILDSAQIAVFVKDCSEGELIPQEENLLEEFNKRSLPYIVVFTKSDNLSKNDNPLFTRFKECSILVSARENTNINLLKDKLASLRPSDQARPFVRDLLKSQDFVVLVIPIDKAAPQGRLILPQQIALRDILDGGAIPVCTSVENLPYTLASLKKEPAMVITDSQAFAQVKPLVPENIFLTSFSILMARFKGTL
ncbi:[FeFe] hydrogenase H-cluster maturation GTPase HydF, partial [Treponema sp.]|uniref:[FeFe] hydrogenase H-cluster maturation GTPase HydF n=1 Tax=Treponema sp. TaxID=166 RepID=UPI0025DED0BA